MRDYILKTTNLTKEYQGVKALKNVSIELESGKIYGLIGQNGAGKTSLMRLIAGHTFPTDGHMELFGEIEGKAMQQERKRLGCIIENPSYLPNMSASDNIEYYRIIRGIPNKEINDELLDLVGLKGTGKKKAKDFSLGMRQRLGIAIALLGNPELLILDEPINGLDPLGVIEIRKLIKRLCEERQITILISSHNLPEMYQTATDYIILHKGEVKEKLTLEELDDKCKQHLRICCHDLERLATVLELELKTENFMVLPNEAIKLYDFLDDKERISKVLAQNEIYMTNFSLEGDTLENYFMSVIGGVQHV